MAIFAFPRLRLRHKQRVAGSVLWLLQDSLRIEFFDGGTDLFGLMPDYGTTRLGFSGSAATNYVLDQSTPAGGCSTFAREDFSRVPFPAARITITTSLFA